MIPQSAQRRPPAALLASLVFGALLLAAALPAAARATVVVSYSSANGIKIGGGGSGDVVDVVGLENPSRYQITDSGGVNVGSGCSLTSPTQALCPVTGNTDVTAVLGGGPDRITATSAVGDMSVNGGAGEDDLRGGRSSDHLYGGAGNDTLRGLSGDDELEGGVDNDTFVGDGGGTDTMLGGDGHDTFQALRYSVFPDHFDGGPGRDTADYSLRRMDLYLSEWEMTGPNDGVFDSERDDLQQVETFVGGSGDDSLLVGALVPAGADPAISMAGNGGDDSLLIGSNELRGYLDGGSGADTFFLAAPSAGIVMARDGEADAGFFCGDEQEFITADFVDAPFIQDECGPVTFGP